MDLIDGETVLALARAERQEWIDAAAAARIAAGASAVVAAVHAALPALAPGLPSADGEEFAAVLESLAGPEA